MGTNIGGTNLSPGVFGKEHVPINPDKLSEKRFIEQITGEKIIISYQGAFACTKISDQRIPVKSF